MSAIDRQRIAAVRVLQVLGYTFDGVGWAPPAEAVPSTLEGDAIHAMMVRRVEEISSRTGHEIELQSLTIAINAYESVRWRA
jgi:hypothetical protein